MADDAQKCGAEEKVASGGMTNQVKTRNWIPHEPSKDWCCATGSVIREERVRCESGVMLGWGGTTQDGSGGQTGRWWNCERLDERIGNSEGPTAAVEGGGIDW